MLLVRYRKATVWHLTRGDRTLCGRAIPGAPGGLSRAPEPKATCLSCLDNRHGILFGREPQP
jgi:hypothetical protein